MNKIQQKAGIAIAQHGPMTTLEISRHIKIGSETLRNHLTSELFDFRWKRGSRGRAKVWFLRGDAAPVFPEYKPKPKKIRRNQYFTQWELTKAEYDILQIVNNGKTTLHDIATVRQSSQRTVQTHLVTIYRKMDVPNMTGMLWKYINEGQTQ